MEYKLFYSWQSDTPRGSNKDFIREALNEVVESKKPSIEDRLFVESGMDRVPGTPEVATIMFDKIRRSSIFVADVTLVGTIPSLRSNRKRKRTANPNVLLEMGYAAGTMGWPRIICVMNEHFGKREDQPVDVRNRRYPINYTLDPKNARDKANRAAVKKGLVTDLEKAIETLEIAEHLAVDDAIESLDLPCMELMLEAGRTTWFSVSRPENMSQLLRSIPRGAEIHRFLDLRLLLARASAGPGLFQYAYHWTYLGKLTLVKLGIRVHIDDYDNIVYKDVPPLPLQE